jgi:hypothetical protein
MGEVRHYRKIPYLTTSLGGAQESFSSPPHLSIMEYNKLKKEILTKLTFH